MVEIPLRGGCAAIIDDEDEGLVKRHRWRALRQPHTTYAIARLPPVKGKQQTLYLHRLVMHAKPGQVIIHLNRNGLDNRRANLRLREAETSGATGPHADGPLSVRQVEGTSQLHEESGR